MFFSPPIIQSALAGYTTTSFIQKILDYDVGMVTFGGYSITDELKKGSRELLQRGREEIIVPSEFKEFQKWCDSNLRVEKKTRYQKIAINIRLSANLDELTLEKIKIFLQYVDVIEINAHCRQKEIIQRKGGEYLLENMDHLDYVLRKAREIIPKGKSLGLKIRGYTVKEKERLVDIVETNFVDYLHIDCMEPGKPHANIQLIKVFSELSDVFIIGNNSVRTVSDIESMLQMGASAVSIARPLIADTTFIKKLIAEWNSRSFK